MKQAAGLFKSFTGALQHSPTIQRAAMGLKRRRRLVNLLLASTGIVTLTFLLLVFVLAALVAGGPREKWDKFLRDWIWVYPPGFLICATIAYYFFHDRLKQMRAARLAADQERHRRQAFDAILGVILLVCPVVQFIFFSLALIMGRAFYNDWAWTILTTVVTNLGCLLLFIANHYWLAPCWLTGTVFMALYMRVVTLTLTPTEVFYSSNLSFWTMAVLVSSFIIRPWASLVVALLLGPLLLFFARLANLPDYFIVIEAMFVFAFMALLSWFVSGNLERALKELLLLNRELEQRVQDRTREAHTARVAAEQANAAKSIFLANMSHELRTPLNAILGFAQLLVADLTLSDRQRESLRIINSSGEHLSGLINDVLDLSKIDAGRMTYNEQEFDLHRLLDDLEDMFLIRAQGKGLNLTLERQSAVPQFIRSDMKKLRQALINLLGNAIKFTSTGAVALRVRLDKDTGAQDTAAICFEIKDTGPGIPPQDQTIIFEPFVQASQFHEGTGLGLPISRQFARLLGGDLTLTSQVGQGSTFTFTLVAAVAAHPELNNAQLQPLRHIVHLQPGQHFRLLIADDRESNRLLLVQMLEPLGFELKQAANGQEALDLLIAWQPDLILLDIRMPVVDGREATRRIRAIPQGRHIPIIALTASAFEEEFQSIRACGCDNVLRKPFRLEEIIEILSQYLGARFVYQEQAGAAQTPLSPIHPADLSALPADWRERLRQAALTADAQAGLHLIAEIGPAHPQLAAALTHLVNTFQFELLLELAQEDQDV